MIIYWRKPAISEYAGIVNNSWDYLLTEEQYLWDLRIIRIMKALDKSEPLNINIGKKRR